MKYREIIADKLSAPGFSWGLLQRRYPRWLTLGSLTPVLNA